MRPAPVVAGWRSSEIASLVAAEIGGPLGAAALLAALPRAVPGLGPAKFLVVTVSRISLGDVALAHAAFVRAGGTARICLAARRDTIQGLSGVNTDHIGLMLDEVDLETSCADLTRDDLEAVRFSNSFVDLAAGDMRTACALSALQRLAKDLGLLTFGSAAGAASFDLERRPFDYEPAEIDPAISGRVRQASPAPAALYRHAEPAGWTSSLHSEEPGFKM